MKLLKISHLGIATPTQNEAMERLDRLFGLKQDHLEEVADQKVRVAFYPIGESNLEYLEPTSPDAAVGKYLEKNPSGGIHHLAFEVDDVDAAVKELLEKGVRMMHSLHPSQRDWRRAHRSLPADSATWLISQ